MSACGTSVNAVKNSNGPDFILEKMRRGPAKGSYVMPLGKLAAGSYELTAQYAGDRNKKAISSASVTLTVD